MVGVGSWDLSPQHPTPNTQRSFPGMLAYPICGCEEPMIFSVLLAEGNRLRPSAILIILYEMVPASVCRISKSISSYIHSDGLGDHIERRFDFL